MTTIRNILLTLALAAGLGLYGCGSKTVCDEACDHLKSCGVGNVQCSGDCNAAAEKQANCIKNLSCDDAKDFLKLAACTQ